MRNFKKWSSLAALLFVMSVRAFSQCLFVDVPDTTGQHDSENMDRVLCESRNGGTCPLQVLYASSLF